MTDIPEHYILATGGGNTWIGTILFVLVFGTPIFGIPVLIAWYLAFKYGAAR